MTYRDNGEHLFVLGSARSGTSLMSSIVQSSSVYAIYNAETKLLHSSISKYGSLSSTRSRKRFLNDWFNSRQFKRTGLTEKDIRDATAQQDSYIGFLGTYMNMMAKKQGCERWVDDTPSNANCLSQISQAFPRAKVIHMVRDGRAVSSSLAKLGWSGIRTIDFDKALVFSALKWQRVVDAVHRSRSCLGERFLEVSYENLVLYPAETLKEVSDFLQIPAFDLSLLEGSYVESNESVKSALQKPNSLYGDMAPGISKNAVYRWKSVLSEAQINLIEENVGDSIVQLGYSLVSSAKQSPYNYLVKLWRKVWFKIKRFAKRYTILGRLSVSSLEVGCD